MIQANIKAVPHGPTSTTSATTHDGTVSQLNLAAEEKFEIAPIDGGLGVSEADATDQSQAFTDDEAKSRQRTLERDSYWTEARLAALNKEALEHFDRVVYSFLGLSMRIDIYDDANGVGYGWDQEPGADYVQLDDGYNGYYGVNRRTGAWGREHGELWDQGDMISLAEAALRSDDRLDAASHLGGYLNSELERDREEIVRILIVQPKIKADPVPRPIGLGTNFLTWLSDRIAERIANPAPERSRTWLFDRIDERIANPAPEGSQE